MYDDAYPTCAVTHATFCIYPGDVDPAAVTERLGVEPSRWQRRGEIPRRADGGFPGSPAPIDGWFLESRGRVDSRDSRRHIDWLLDVLEPRADALRTLREAGCRMVVWCYWLSRRGDGGPTMPAAQMGRLAELGLDVYFYFLGPVEDGRD